MNWSDPRVSTYLAPWACSRWRFRAGSPNWDEGGRRSGNCHCSQAMRREAGDSVANQGRGFHRRRSRDSHRSGRKRKNRQRWALVGNAGEAHFPDIELRHVKAGVPSERMKRAQDRTATCGDSEAAIHKSPVAGPVLLEQQVRVEGAQRTKSAWADEVQGGAEGVYILVWLKARRVQVQLGRREFISQIEPKRDRKSVV